MVVDELLTELRARGVTLTAKDGELHAEAPKGTITPGLYEAVKAQKAALMLALQGPSGADPLLPLPSPLAYLIRAAVSPGLNFRAELPNGYVSDLGSYVLATAALYAVGHDTERQLGDLWIARRAWTANNMDSGSSPGDVSATVSETTDMSTAVRRTRYGEASERGRDTQPKEGQGRQDDRVAGGRHGGPRR